jgi:hypothetical protein
MKPSAPRWVSQLPLWLFFALYSPQSPAAATFHQLLTSLVRNDLLHEELKDSGPLGVKFCSTFDGQSCGFVTSFGEGICRAGGGDMCGYVTSIGEGICRAGGGDMCSYVTSIGEGICRAGGGDMCSYVTSIGEGICRAGRGNLCTYVTSVEEGYSRYLENFKDRQWDWDQFYDRYGNLVWMCRGVQTGQFAEDDKCDGKYQTDRRWPRKTAP